MRGWILDYDDDLAEPIRLCRPPTRTETVLEAWRLYSDSFNYETGKLQVIHNLGVIEPITFELIDYGATTVIEAEGVVVARFPRIA